jgi:hypothetical protein
LAGSWAIFICFFLLPRLPFFLAYPVVSFPLDDGGYFMLVDQMAKGFLPHLSVRTIGYPLFLKLVFCFSDRNFTVVAVQHLLTLFCALLFIYAVHRFYGRFRLIPVLTALALGVFASSSRHMRLDCTLLTDSLFVNLVLFSLALLLLGLGLNRKWILAAASSAMAATILVRPAGMFIVPVYLLVIIFLLSGHYGRRAVTAFILPFASMLLALGIYNRLTIGTFAISTFSEASLISLTSTFLEEHPSFGVAGNEAVRDCRRAVKKSDLRVLASSWEYGPISRVLRKYYEKNRIRVTHAFFNHEPADSFNLYLKWRPLLRKMGIYAIRRHPWIALKYLYSKFMIYFFSNRRGADDDFYKRLEDNFLWSRSLREHFSGFVIPDSFFSRMYNTRSYAATLSPAFLQFMLKEYHDPPSFSHISLSADGSVILTPTIWKSLHTIWQNVYSALFRQIFWILLFFLTFLYALYRLVATRGRHLGTFFLFLMTFSALGYGILVVLSAFPYLRYVSALEYVYYLCPVLFAISRLPDPRVAGK